MGEATGLVTVTQVFFIQWVMAFAMAAPLLALNDSHVTVSDLKVTVGTITNHPATKQMRDLVLIVDPARAQFFNDAHLRAFISGDGFLPVRMWRNNPRRAENVGIRLARIGMFAGLIFRPQRTDDLLVNGLLNRGYIGGYFFIIYWLFFIQSTVIDTSPSGRGRDRKVKR